MKLVKEDKNVATEFQGNTNLCVYLRIEFVYKGINSPPNDANAR